MSQHLDQTACPLRLRLTSALGRSHRVLKDEAEWVGERQGLSCGIDDAVGRKRVGNLPGEDVDPDTSGDGVAEGGADRVRREVQGGDDGEALVLHRGLHEHLHRVREHPSADTKQDLTGDEARQAAVLGGSVPDEDAEGEDEDGRAGHDEPLGAAHVADDEAEGNTDDDGDERVDVLDTGDLLDRPGVSESRVMMRCRRGDSQVKSDEQQVVQVVCRQRGAIILSCERAHRPGSTKRC